MALGTGVSALALAVVGRNCRLEPRRPADATTVLPTMDEVGHPTQQDHNTGNSRRGLLSDCYPDRVDREIISPGSDAQRLWGALREFLAELGEEAA